MALSPSAPAVSFAQGRTMTTGLVSIDEAGLHEGCPGEGFVSPSPWIAFSTHATVETRVGREPYGFYEFGLRWRKPFAGSREFSYVADIIPVAVLTNTPLRFDYHPCSPGSVGVCPTAIKRPAYGIGAAPLGLEIALTRIRNLSVLGRGAVGVLWFTRPVPDPEAKRLNFTAVGGVEMDYRFSQKVQTRLELVAHHASNAGSGLANPGMNAFLVVLGLDFAR
jgi:hypothetical protein